VPLDTPGTGQVLEAGPAHETRAEVLDVHLHLGLGLAGRDLGAVGSEVELPGVGGGVEGVVDADDGGRRGRVVAPFQGPGYVDDADPEGVAAFAPGASDPGDQVEHGIAERAYLGLDLAGEVVVEDV